MRKLYRVLPADVLTGTMTPVEADHDPDAATLLTPASINPTAATTAQATAAGWRRTPAEAYVRAAEQLREAATRAALAAIAAEGPEPIRCYYFGDADGVPGTLVFRGSNPDGPMPVDDAGPLPESVRVAAQAPAACGVLAGPDGTGALAVVDGWTVLGFWDRSAAPLPLGRSVFVVEGVREFAEVMRLAELRFPSAIDRLRRNGVDVVVGASYWSSRVR